ncbi:STAS domain-containing protein [Streptomyces coelicoflavus]|uniref:STAS domain-containing protein n=1 Tax=Streptomyces TaxID=1883 RepID=UPI0019EC3F48|nr:MULTISPECIES: STAS domain-containing protein [Streptomyces]KAF2780454.1 anti-sigma-factor antagonist [Streptomyces sp. OM5714]MCX5038161.1 STAS domain-containing protein [Streptomyces coelicoflavus]
MIPEAEPLQILPSTDPYTLCLALVGDLDHEVGDEVLYRAREALRGCEGVRSLRLNCRELEMADSTGLSVLLQLRRDAHEAGIRFHLDDTRPVLERLLRITGTHDYLTCASAACLPPEAEAAIETGEGESGS